MSEPQFTFDRAALDILYPYVVPKSWVEYAGADALVSWPFSDDVRVVLVVDGAGMVRNVRPEDLEMISVSPDEAMDIAVQNLGRAWQAGQFEFGCATLKDGTRIGAARGNWMAPAGGLMLGNLFEALRGDLGCAELAAIAVNQECLFAFPIDEKTLGSTSLRIAVDDEFNGHRKPISRSWLLLNGSWPQPYPGVQSF